MTREAELRATAARILADLHDTPMLEALEVIEQISHQDCYTATVAALGYDPLAEPAGEC